MIWISFLGAIGIGAIIVKALDILLLQKIMYKNEKMSWLREKRLKVYTEVSKDMVSFGFHKEKLSSVFEDLAVYAEAMLLIENDDLINKLEQFLVKRDEMSRLSDQNKDEEGLKIYHDLTEEARSIIKQLRNSIVEKD